jgi:Fe2+ or Zn2+ uptake regulation protein
MFKSIHKTQKRYTRQRTTMRRAFEDAERWLPAQEILRLPQHARPGLELTKFCRNLKVMTAGGFLAKVRLPGENLRGRLHCPDLWSMPTISRCKAIASAAW